METFSPKGKIFGPILPQFILEKRITLGAKVMYALLCNYASEKDHCWPSHATLASRLSCSISSVKNYLAELMRENLIAIRKEHYRSSVYYLIRPEHNDNADESNPERSERVFTCNKSSSGYINNFNKQKQEKHTRQVGDEQILQILQEAYSPQRDEVSRKENCYGKEREFRSCKENRKG